MKFSACFFALAIAATSVMAQVASPNVVDDLFSREDLEVREEKTSTHSLREIEDVHARNAEEIHFVKRDLERLERRGRMACYAACNAFTGANKVACWRRCDKIWGNTP